MTFPDVSRPGVRPLASLQFQAIAVARAGVERLRDETVTT
jgi:hypothetical protein